MIELTTSSGAKIYLAKLAIASVTEAGASSQWHGIRSYVKTFDGKTLEIQETAAYIAGLL